ncbi:MAG TPA: hypothetical protein PLS07_09675 [Niabella sp.]|nr:hypothetical protein [Niabella sp.]HQW13933.1 hypothetical protein [Niabella sp.]HQX19174.1 hypothetical protein [Niabella sp.]HRB06271.1 hypothetical protein [Niabella sp.]HRB26927.1 hypothetical protein [Niabella sp.]
MTIVIILLLIGGYIYWNGISEPAELKRLLVGKTQEQQDVIKYFFGKGGFLTKRISDAEYDNLVANKAGQTDFKQKALNKIGVDESEVREIEPVNFQWYDFDNSTYDKKGADNIWRSSAYEITWMFFSGSQIMVYQYLFHMDKSEVKENTEEYFYKDVVSFSTRTGTVQSKTGNAQINTNVFRINLPGDNFETAIRSSDDSVERVIQGMKAKLREKKS